MDNGNNSNSGVYRLVNTVTGQYYIGSTANLYSRKYTHMSGVKHNNTRHKSIKAINVNPSDWVFEVLEYVGEPDLLKRETYYIQTHIHDPNCLNIRTVATTTKGHTKSLEGRNNMARAFVGKNRAPGKPIRSAFVCFIRDGVRYYTTNVADFAREHGIQQATMNQLANGQLKRAGDFILAPESAPIYVPIYKMENVYTGKIDYTTNPTMWAKTNGVSKDSINRMRLGTVKKNHRGWTLTKISGDDNDDYLIYSKYRNKKRVA